MSEKPGPGSLPALPVKQRICCWVASSLIVVVTRRYRNFAPFVRQIGERKGGVENRRSGVSLPVAHNAAFARVASVRLGMALFPVPAHRTEQARFAHSALGESVTRSPTES